MSGDVIDALMQVSYAFKKLNMEVPDAILLKSNEQGLRLLSELHQMSYMIIPFDADRGGSVLEHPDGSVWMEVEVYGMKVRWPAKKLALPQGGYRWF